MAVLGQLLPVNILLAASGSPQLVLDRPVYSSELGCLRILEFARLGRMTLD